MIFKAEQSPKCKLSLPENQRRQLLEGNWDVAEGAAFPEFNREIHVIDPVEVPRNWVKFRADRPTAVT